MVAQQKKPHTLGETSAQLSVLLFHTEVHWLSKGNMFECLYELKSEVEMMLLQLGKDDLRENFTDENIFETINNLNFKVQGRNTIVIIANDSINSFLEKITAVETPSKQRDS